MYCICNFITEIIKRNMYYKCRSFDDLRYYMTGFQRVRFNMCPIYAKSEAWVHKYIIEYILCNFHIIIFVSL